MKKIFFALSFFFVAVSAKAQYGTINKILDELEARRGINENLKDINIDDKKFVLMQDFDDHTERQFIIIKGKEATFAEVFDDKSNGETSSNVFSGDVIRTANNVLSFRFDKLEGKKIALPIVKNMILAKQKKILYLIDVNTKQRWIDETAIGKN